MIENLVWVEDGAPLTSLPEPLVTAAINNEWCDGSSNNLKLRFVGYANLAGHSFFSLPKTVLLDNKTLSQKIESGRTVFHSIAKYARDVKTLRVAGEQYDEKDEQSLSRILLFQELIDDWARNGIYRQVQYQDRVSNRGRILWHQTVAQQLPFIDDGGPIYLDTISRSRSRTTDFLISKLHAWAVSKADRELGWLYAGSGKTKLFDELQDIPPHIPVEAPYALTILKKRLNQTFDSRTIWLLRSLVRIIEFEADFAGSNFVYGIRSFWRVWEHMCRKRFVTSEAHEALLKSMPRPYYHYPDGSKEEPFTRQLPDILEKVNEDEICVRDAKYYDVSKSAPAWADVVKQLFYSETIRAAGLAARTTTVFLFPASEQGNLPTEIKIHDTSGAPLPGLNPIKCEYLDLLEVCQEYLKGQN